MRTETWNLRWAFWTALLLALGTILVLVSGTTFTTNEERPLYELGQMHRPAGIAVGVLALGLAMLLARGGRQLRVLTLILLGTAVFDVGLGFQPYRWPVSL